LKKENQILITKASGDIAQFSPEKLKRSLLNAGASGNLAKSMVDVSQQKKSVVIIFNLLKEISSPLAAKKILKPK